MGIIGDELRRARTAMGLSLPDVEEGTKIRVKYLEAIENEEFNIIPGKVYIKGFLKNYAEFLGLDSRKMLEYLNEYNSEIIMDMEEEDNIIVPTLANNNSFIGNKNTYILSVVLSIILLGVFVTKFYGSNENKSNEIANNRPQSTNVKTQSKESSKTLNKGEGKNNSNKSTTSQEVSTVNPKEVAINQNQVKPTSDSKVNLTLTAAREESWALVKVDGIQQFIGIIKKNQVLSFGGQNSVYIRLGNAGAVDIIYNGNKIDPIGALHKVSKKTFTVNGIQ